MICIRCRQEKPLNEFASYSLARSEYWCRDCRREYDQGYYQNHKEEIRTKQRLYYNAHRREYYLVNREQIISRTRVYNQLHKQELNDKKRESRRLHEIRYHNHRNNIKGLNKLPYPPNGDCQICGQVALLGYHHWTDLNPNLGIWLCTRCHRKIHKNLRQLSQPQVSRSTLLDKLYKMFIIKRKKAKNERLSKVVLLWPERFYAH